MFGYVATCKITAIAHHVLLAAQRQAGKTSSYCPACHHMMEPPPAIEIPDEPATTTLPTQPVATPAALTTAPVLPTSTSIPSGAPLPAAPSLQPSDAIVPRLNYAQVASAQFPSDRSVPRHPALPPLPHNLSPLDILKPIVASYKTAADARDFSIALDNDFNISKHGGMFEFRFFLFAYNRTIVADETNDEYTTITHKGTTQARIFNMTKCWDNQALLVDHIIHSTAIDINNPLNFVFIAPYIKKHGNKPMRLRIDENVKPSLIYLRQLTYPTKTFGVSETSLMYIGGFKPNEDLLPPPQPKKPRQGRKKSSTTTNTSTPTASTTPTLPPSSLFPNDQVVIKTEPSIKQEPGSETTLSTVLAAVPTTPASSSAAPSSTPAPPTIPATLPADSQPVKIKSEPGIKSTASATPAAAFTSVSSAPQEPRIKEEPGITLLSTRQYMGTATVNEAGLDVIEISDDEFPPIERLSAPKVITKHIVWVQRGGKHVKEEVPEGVDVDTFMESLREKEDTPIEASGTTKTGDSIPRADDVLGAALQLSQDEDGVMDLVDVERVDGQLRKVPSPSPSNHAESASAISKKRKRTPSQKALLGIPPEASKNNKKTPARKPVTRTAAKGKGRRKRKEPICEEFEY
ncbi:hypothetical protein QBC44DRAFT_338084 [Cladorrhinum sp. PSN332]|nr:hypothetical protein QBC44DRAFT_338084 [Cladorrhinum sp. PSN332]